LRINDSFFEKEEFIDLLLKILYDSKKEACFSDIFLINSMRTTLHFASVFLINSLNSQMKNAFKKGVFHLDQAPNQFLL